MENQELTHDAREFLYSALIECLNKTSVKTLSDYLAKKFAEIAGVPEAAIFLRRGDVYTIQGSYSVRKTKIEASQVGYKSPFIRRLKQIDKVIISKYQGDFSVDEFKVLFMKKTLSRFAIDYLVILGGKKFIGFVVLGKSKRGAEGRLSRDTEALLTHLAHQAYGSIDYHIMRDLGEETEGEAREARQMRNHLMKEFPYGILFIEYGTEKIMLANKPVREMFRLSETLIGKRVDELLAAYPDAAFSDFLRAYKEVKARRHSFKAGLFDKYTLHSKDGEFEISSAFIHGAKNKKRGDFITLKSVSPEFYGR